MPDVAIIRATTADERGNLTYEHEGAYLGGLDQALAARNNGGIVIAQVKRVTKEGSLRPHDVRVPGMLVDYVVVDPDQKQTTQTLYDPAISGEIFRPLSSFRVPEFNIQKVIARRVAQELEAGSAVNLGFGISANVPRILMEEGLHGAVTWVIEQGAVGGVPLLDFAFGCASNADAYMPSPYQFTYFQGGGFDASLLSFLEIGADGSVNVSKLAFRPHVTAGAGGFVDITARARKVVFSGLFTAGAKLGVEDGRLVIAKEGKLKKLVQNVEHVTFSGRRAIEQGQDITYVTERCVMKLTPRGVVVTEIAPGVDLEARHARPGRVPADRRRRAEDHGCGAVRRCAARPQSAGAGPIACLPEPMPMAEPKLSIATEGHVAILTVARPEKLNAFDVAMLEELAAACDRLEADPAVRAVVLTGQGKAFSAGGDIKAWSGLAPNAFGHAWVRFGHRVFDRLADAAHAGDRRAQRPCPRRRPGACRRRRHPHRRGADQDRPAGDRARHGAWLVRHAAPDAPLRRPARAPDGAGRRDLRR